MGAARSGALFDIISGEETVPKAATQVRIPSMEAKRRTLILTLFTERR